MRRYCRFFALNDRRALLSEIAAFAKRTAPTGAVNGLPNRAQAYWQAISRSMGRAELPYWSDARKHLPAFEDSALPYLSCPIPLRRKQ
jgi:hypothetical protein